MNTSATETKNSYTLLLTRLEQEEASLRKRKVTIAALRPILETLWLPVTECGVCFDFDNLSHDDVVKVIKAFGGTGVV